MSLLDKQHAPNAAGLLLFCNTAEGPRFIVLLNKWGTRTWGFPKGHIDRKDQGDLITTALRETYEETGLHPDDIKVHCPVPAVVYTMPKPTRNVPSGVKHVAFFLAEIQPTRTGVPPVPVLSKEHTAIEWVTLEQAKARVHPAHADAIESVAKWEGLK